MSISYVIWVTLTACAFRYLMFDFKKFQWWRKPFRNSDNYFISNLFKCRFCQGFHCGWILYIIMLGFEITIANLLIHFIYMMSVGLVSGFLSYTWSLVIYPLIEKGENLGKELGLHND